LSYNLARILGLTEYYGPGVHFRLKGNGLQAFRELIKVESFSGHKEKNRQNLLKQTEDAHVLYCTYKKWGNTPYDLDKLIRSNFIDTDNILVKYISTENKKPGIRQIYLSQLSSTSRKGQAPAAELAKQLSGIMLIDMLTGQWDRFSGGNLQATISNGKLKLASFDNGGTFSYGKASKWFDKYKVIVSRFDRNVIEILFKMNRFLNEKSIDSFSGFNSEPEFRAELGIINGPDNLSKSDWIWRNFKENLSKLIEHIKSVESRYGEHQCYF